MVPETRYARSGNLHIAYQVVGDGPVDLVFVHGWISHIEHLWEEPSLARFLTRLASFSRLILFDKRGTGLSDRIAGVPTLEERMDDIRAVMDDAGSRRAVVFGVSEGATLAALFAATYPERTISLVIYGGMASYVRRPDYPWRPPAEEVLRTWVEEPAKTIHRTWGTTEGLDQVLQWAAPSAAGDEGLKRWLATLQRLGASPGAEIARRRMNLDRSSPGFAGYPRAGTGAPPHARPGRADRRRTLPGIAHPQRAVCGVARSRPFPYGRRPGCDP